MNTALLDQPRERVEASSDSTPEQPCVPTEPTRPTGRRGFAGELRVVLMVLAMFAVYELSFRLAGDRLSKDIAHLQSFGEIAANLNGQTQPGETRVLFLGNSLTRYGVDAELFEQVLREQFGEAVRASKMNPDNTALADWFYAYRTYFSRTQQLPEVMIIGFEGGHLRDAASNHPDRLARYYCTWEDCPDLQRRDVQGFEASAGYVLSSLSAAFGNRDRLQRRVLDLLIPSYRPGMDELNRRMNQQRTPAMPSPPDANPEPSYSRLLELIALAERDGVQVILAAMPVPEAYEFDTGLLEVVHSTSARLVDCRTVPGITRPMFFDGLHMDEQAQHLYTRALATQCAPLLHATPLASAE